MSGETVVWCMLASSVIVSFVMGYVLHWYLYSPVKIRTPCDDEYMSGSRLVTVPSRSIVPPFAGTERFHNAVKSQAEDGSADDNHDNKVIARMKREAPLDPED